MSVAITVTSTTTLDRSLCISFRANVGNNNIRTQKTHENSVVTIKTIKLTEKSLNWSLLINTNSQLRGWTRRWHPALQMTARTILLVKADKWKNQSNSHTHLIWYSQVKAQQQTEIHLTGSSLTDTWPAEMCVSGASDVCSTSRFRACVRARMFLNTNAIHKVDATVYAGKQIVSKS